MPVEVAVENIDTTTLGHRHTNTHTLTIPLSLAHFSFANVCLSTFHHPFLVPFGACRLHLAPLFVAQQHTLQDTFAISLTRAVSDRSPSFPLILPTIISLLWARIPSRSRNCIHSVHKNKMEESNMNAGVSILYFRNGARLPGRMESGLAIISYPANVLE